jgi:RHS repeat-associated protein
VTLAVVDHAGTPILYYAHPDHLGSPQKMTDAAMSVVWDGRFRPFGEEHLITGALTQDDRFPGQRLEAETGYHYNYFRDYDPSTGRYLQSDPIGLLGGLNTYAYVGGNPVRWVDPTGLYLLPFIPLIMKMLDDTFGGDSKDQTRQCPGSDSDNDGSDDCDRQYYDIDIPTCRAIGRARGKDAAQRCYASAAARYSACLKGEPIPPLDTWNQ